MKDQTSTLQSACWFADHLSPLFTMSTPSTYFRSLGDRTTAWMEERLEKKTPAQWENPHFQNGYKSGYWGSEAATFFAMGGASLLKGGYQAATSFLSRKGPRFAQEASVFAGKTTSFEVFSDLKIRNSNSWTNLINPFKGKTFQEIDQIFRKKGFITKGPSPVCGKGSYFSPVTNRKYYLDSGGIYKQGICMKTAKISPRNSEGKIQKS